MTLQQLRSLVTQTFEEHSELLNIEIKEDFDNIYEKVIDLLDEAQAMIDFSK